MAEIAGYEERAFAVIQEAIRRDEIGKPSLAVQLLTDSLAEYANEPVFYIYLAWYLRRTGRFDESIEYGRRAVELLPHSSYSSMVFFQTLWDVGNREDAIQEIRRFLKVRRSPKHTLHYDDILARWEAGDRDAGDWIPLRLFAGRHEA